MKTLYQQYAEAKAAYQRCAIKHPYGATTRRLKYKMENLMLRLLRLESRAA